MGLGTNNTPKWKPASYDPVVEVEILGTTKELQDLEINDTSFSHRLLLITNALDLVRTPNPSAKQLRDPKMMEIYAVTPAQVSKYARNFPPSPAAVTNALDLVRTPNPSVKRLQSLQGIETNTALP